jgi:hypothetical protein
MTLGSYSKLSYEASLQLSFQLWKLGKMRAFRDADPRELRQQIYEMLKDKTLSKAAAKVHIRAGAQLWGLLPVNDHEDKLERDARAPLHQQAEAAFRAADRHAASGSPQICLLPSGAARPKCAYRAFEDCGRRVTGDPELYYGRRVAGDPERSGDELYDRE